MIELEGMPELVDPVMIAAFEGWNDAADAATGAVEHLQTVWEAQPLAALDPEDYYDFQVNRPSVAFDAAGTRRVTWPTTSLSVVRRPAAVEAPEGTVGDAVVATGGQSSRPEGAAREGAPGAQVSSERAESAGRPRSGDEPALVRDIVLIRGIEPNIRWRSFAAELVGLAQELGVDMVVTLGALLADSPHTRPIPVSGTSTDPEVARALHLEQSRYEGPTGIVGVLQDACTKAGLPAMSIWAAVPHYVAQPPCPKATLALLRRVEDLLDLPIPMGDLPEDARAWERGVDELAAEDTEVSEYVRALEEAKDTAEHPEASGEAIAREFERYLRRRDEGGRGPGSR